MANVRRMDDTYHNTSIGTVSLLNIWHHWTVYNIWIWNEIFKSTWTS